jgi:DivIVA domain-containing protein
VTYSILGLVHGFNRRFEKGELKVEPESANTFTRRFRGYDPAAVDAHIEMLATKQQLLVDDVESLRARVRELGEEAAGLRKEIALLTETSPTPHAVQQRMANMLRRTVDEAAELQAEARAEAAALIAAAEAQIEAERRKHEDQLAELAAQIKAREAEYAKAKQTLHAELDRMRIDAQTEREQLLADVKLKADRYREQARQAADEATRQQVKVLEHLMGVYRDLEPVPAALEAAHQELKNPTEG